MNAKGPFETRERNRLEDVGGRHLGRQVRDWYVCRRRMLLVNTITRCLLRKEGEVNKTRRAKNRVEEVTTRRLAPWKYGTNKSYYKE